MLRWKTMNSLFKDTLAKIQSKISAEGSVRKFALRHQMNPTTISRWFAEQRSPDFQSLCIILEHFGARIVFPDDPDPKSETPAPAVPETERPTTITRQLSQALKENTELKKQMDVLRTERDIAIGEARALRIQIERLVPGPEKRSSGDSKASGGNFGESERIA